MRFDVVLVPSQPVIPRLFPIYRVCLVPKSSKGARTSQDEQVGLEGSRSGRDPYGQGAKRVPVGQDMKVVPVLCKTSGIHALRSLLATEGGKDTNDARAVYGRQAGRRLDYNTSEMRIDPQCCEDRDWIGNV